MLIRSNSLPKVLLPAPFVPARCHLSPPYKVQFRLESRVIPSRVTFRSCAWTKTLSCGVLVTPQKVLMSKLLGKSRLETMVPSLPGSPALPSPDTNDPTKSAPLLPIRSSVLSPPFPKKVTLRIPSAISSRRCVNSKTCVLAVSLASPTPWTRISIRNPLSTLSTISCNPPRPWTSSPSNALSNTSSSGLDTSARTSNTRRTSPVLRVSTRRGRRGYIPSLTARNFAAGDRRFPPEGMRARWTVVVVLAASRRISECESKDTWDRK
mmetsp:Transcript_21189/g.51175  ORF Transcript_21189/g.51175 Transcript_21189/m.51175 type:complete len:266 (+) Transcript_21189:933-1730(+)